MTKVFVAGHKGLVGSAICRNLRAKGIEPIIADRRKVDLTIQEDVYGFMEREKPDYVYLAAAKVGGIKANENFKAEFIYENLMIQTNVIDAAYVYDVKKLLFLGSSCIYPKMSNIPIIESELLTGPLEPTNDAYAIAKIAGVKMCQSYREQYGFNAIAVMPTNLYGPGDNFHPENSHVLPGLIDRFHKAKLNNDTEVVCWGDGSPMREFLHVDDLAEACTFLMDNYDSGDIINVGTGIDINIRGLADIVASVVGYEGFIIWDTTKPNGTFRKVLNVDKIKSLGWQPKINLLRGVMDTYEWYKSPESLRRRM
jgi:GDP-L-fucose synthase